jgi:O-antigen/teichoic acid export membrane protein
MRSFSNQGMLVMILNIIVWNRSDIVLLKYLTTDLAQISFYSVGFNLTEKVLLLGRVVGASSGATLMAQYGRDKTKMFNLVSGSAKYMFQLIAPLLVGMAALSSALVPAIYGREYLPAIVPLAIVSSFAVLSAVVLPARSLLQATEKQGFLIGWTAVAALVNIGVDVWLVPQHGAVGAAIGNCSAQLLATVGIWWRAISLFRFPMPWTSLVKTCCVIFVMGLVMMGIAAVLSPWAAILAGTTAGGLIYLAGIRLTRALDQTDYARLRQMVPSKLGPARPWVMRLLRFMIPTVRPSST